MDRETTRPQCKQEKLLEISSGTLSARPANQTGTPGEGTLPKPWHRSDVESGIYATRGGGELSQIGCSSLQRVFDAVHVGEVQI